MNSALLVDYSESETDNTYHYLTQREFIQKHSVSKSQFEYQDYGVFDKLYQAIMRKKPLSFHPIFCRAQTGSFVFDPYGNIYPCWEVVGRPEHCIGHYACAGGVSGVRNLSTIGIRRIYQRFRLVPCANMLCYADADVRLII